MVDEEYVENDPEIGRLWEKQRYYTREDQLLLARKQYEALEKVLPAYRESSATGQIEISTSSFYHPILPLLCDSSIAHQTDPYVPLPSRFCYPGGGAEQLSRTRSFVASKLGAEPTGLWPSEGCISAQTLELAARSGFRWIASDDRILARSLGEPLSPSLTAQPYVYRRNGAELNVILRDHHLSDLIGFVYPRTDGALAAEHFLNEIRSRSSEALAKGKDALVPVILDGKNAWEHYPVNGRGFLRELYRKIEAEPGIAALTITEAIAAMPSRELLTIVPGSWIDPTFDMWIGADEDNRAWEHLLAARRTFDRVSQSAASLGKSAKASAWEELGEPVPLDLLRPIRGPQRATKCKPDRLRSFIRPSMERNPCRTSPTKLAATGSRSGPAACIVNDRCCGSYAMAPTDLTSTWVRP